MAGKLKVVFSGLCTFTPDANWKIVSVPLVDGRLPQLCCCDGSTLDAHIPILTYPKNGSYRILNIVHFDIEFAGIQEGTVTPDSSFLDYVIDLHQVRKAVNFQNGVINKAAPSKRVASRVFLSGGQLMGVEPIELPWTISKEGGGELTYTKLATHIEWSVPLIADNLRLTCSPFGDSSRPGFSQDFIVGDGEEIVLTISNICGCDSTEEGAVRDTSFRWYYHLLQGCVDHGHCAVPEAVTGPGAADTFCPAVRTQPV